MAIDAKARKRESQQRDEILYVQRFDLWTRQNKKVLEPEAYQAIFMSRIYSSSKADEGLCNDLNYSHNGLF